MLAKSVELSTFAFCAALTLMLLFAVNFESLTATFFLFEVNVISFVALISEAFWTVTLPSVDVISTFLAVAGVTWTVKSNAPAVLSSAAVL